MVAEANTVVDPRAMMIHLEYAHSAYPAMMTPIWLVFRTPFAVASLARAFRLLLSYAKCVGAKKAYFLRHILPACVTSRLPIWDGAGMRQNTFEVANK